MMRRSLAHHPAWNMRQRSIELMDDEHVSTLETLTPNDNRRRPHTAGETDNKSARRRPDTRQYVAASTGTGKTHVGQTGALTGLRYAPNFRN